MDQFYFESGYIADGYYAYQAEATATLTTSLTLTAQLTDSNLSYFVPDYIATDYFATVKEAIAIQGVSFSVTAELTDTNESYFVPDYIATDYFEIPVGITEEAAAAFTSATSITAAVGRIVSGQIALASAGTFSLAAAVNKSTDISLSSQFTQTAAASRTRTTAVALASQFTQTAVVSINRDLVVAFSSQATLNAQLSGVKQGQANFVVQTIDLGNSLSTAENPIVGVIAGITKAFNAILEPKTQQTASATITASAELAAQSQFTQSTQGSRTKEFTASVTGAFSPTCTANALINQVSIMEAVVTMSITAQANKVAAAALSVQASQSTDNIRIRFGDSSLSSQFTSSAQGTKQFADAVITATVAFTQSTAIDKTAGVQSTLTANFAQTTAIAKTVGYSVAVSSQFTQTAEASKIFGYSAAVASQFTQSTLEARTRNLDAAVSVQVNVNVTAFRIIENAAAISGAFTPTMTVNAQRAGVALLETATTFQISAVANRSITLALENIANLNSQAAKTVGYNLTVTATAILAASAAKSASASSALTSQFTISVNALSVQFAQASIASTSSIFTTRYFGSQRPHSSGIGSNEFSSDRKKYGTHSLFLTNPANSYRVNSSGDFLVRANQDFVFEMWVDASDYEYFAGVQSLFAGVGRAQSDMSNFLTTTDHWHLGTDANGRLQFKYNTGSAVITMTTTQNVVAGTSGFKHIAVTRTAGVIQLYWQGTAVGSSSTHSGAFGIPTLTANRTLCFKNNGISFTDLFIDEVSYRHGTSTIQGLTAPVVNDPDTQVILLHFDNAFTDDISVVQLGAAALTSAFSLTATAQELSSGQATLVSTLTLSALASVNRSAVISATTAVSQTATATRIKTLDSTISSQFSLSATIEKIVPAESAVSVAATLSADVVRVKSFDIAIAGAFTPTLTAEAFKNHVANLTLASTLSVVVSKTLDGAADLSTAVTATITALRLAPASASVSSQFTLTANGGKFKLGTVNIGSAFTATVSVQYFEGTSLIAPMAAVMSVTAVKTARITQTLSSNANIVTQAIRAPRDSEYPITDRALLHFDSQPAVDEFGGTVTNGTYTTVTGNFANAAGRPVSTPLSITRTNGIFDNLDLQSAWTIDFWFQPRELTFNNVYPITGLLSLTDTAPSGGQDPNTLIGWQQTSNLSSGSPKTAQGRIFIGAWFGQDHGSSLKTFSYSATGSMASTFSHVAITYENLGSIGGGSYNIRTRIFIDGVMSGPLTTLRTPGNYPSTNLKILPTIFQITDRDGLGSFTRTAEANIDELRFMPGVQYTANFTPPVAPYSPVVNFKAGAGILESRASLAIVGFNVQIFASSQNVVSTLTASASRARIATATMSTTASISTVAVKSVSAASAMSTAVTQNTQALLIAIAAANLSAVSTLTASAERRRNTAVTLNASASQITGAVKTTETTTDLSVVLTLAAEAIKTARGQVTLAHQAAQTTLVTRIRSAEITISGAMQFVAGVDLIPPLRTTANMSVSVNMTTTAITVSQGTISAVATSTVSVSVTRIRSQNVNVTAQVTQNTVIGRLVGLVATELNVQGFQVTVGFVINIDPNLTIRILPESRVLTITGETRLLLVLSETRLLTIKG